MQGQHGLRLNENDCYDFIRKRDFLIKGLPDGVSVTTQTTPGPKDILFGRGRGVFPHVGNRVFRQVIKLHLYDYVFSHSRKYKTAMVRSIVDLFRDNGYRFLKHSKETGTFNIIGDAQAATKIGHALRDRSPDLGSICREKLKTRAQLLHEGISILIYAEFLTRKKGVQDEYDKSSESVVGEAASTNKQTKRPREEAQHPTNYSVLAHSTRVAQSTKPESSTLCTSSRSELTGELFSAMEIAASSCLTPFGKGKTAFVENGGVCQRSEQKVRRTINQTESATQRLIPFGNAKASNVESGEVVQDAPQNLRTINEIVIPTMKNGNLPAGGYWKFFPLYEIEHHTVDMGPSVNGWKLKLEPISFDANPIFLDIV